MLSVAESAAAGIAISKSESMGLESEWIDPSISCVTSQFTAISASGMEPSDTSLLRHLRLPFSAIEGDEVLSGCLAAAVMVFVRVVRVMKVVDPSGMGGTDAMGDNVTVVVPMVLLSAGV